MSIALVVMGDGRDDYLGPAVASAHINLRGPIIERWMHDDTGSDTYRHGLAQRFPTFTHLGDGERRGFGGAISYVWDWLAAHSDARWVLHLEADFIINRPVDLVEMSEVLEARPYLTQMALRRQSWNAAERAAGGVVEQHPDAYTEVSDGPAVWLEHRRFWTTNPCLFPRDLCRRGWPTGAESEGRFGINLFQSDPALRAGFWGARHEPPWVEHIGQQRVGHGY
jgi:hypothetical protein